MKKPVALQLYTLRHEAEKDFEGTLRLVAEIGFKGVEFAGLHGRDPKEVASLLDSLGLQVCSNHSPLPTKENISQIVDTESILKNTRLITCFLPDDLKSVDGCKKAAEQINAAAELLAPHGMTLGYHNHWWEFDKVENGRYPYDILMAESPALFGELDIYWVAYSHINPTSMVSRYKSRLPLLHVKDGLLEKDGPHLPLGSGLLKIPEILNAADPDVLKWFIVELDDYEGFMPDAVRESYKYMVENDFAEGSR